MSRWPVAPAAVALDLLDEPERPVADALLRDDAAFRAEVERLRATTRVLEQMDLAGWRPEPPPPLDDDRALVVRPPVARRRWWRASGVGLVGAGAVAAAAVVVAVVVAVGGGHGDGPSGPAPMRATVDLQALNRTPGTARLTISGDRVQLRGRGLPPSGPHDFYEAWLADARGRMVSMGTFRVDRRGRVDAEMTLGVDVRRYRLVDVSLEPDDGNPAHSTTSVLRAKLRS